MTEIWRDPTAARYYADDPSSADALYSAAPYPDTVYSNTPYSDAPYSDAPYPDAEYPETVPLPPPPLVYVEFEPEPEPAVPVRPPVPVPVAAPVGWQQPPQRNRLPSARRPTPTVPWQDPSATLPWQEPARAQRVQTSAEAAQPPARRKRAGKAGWLPGVLILAIVLFLANGGSGLIRDLFDRNSSPIPSGVTNSVQLYYSDTASGGDGRELLCSTQRALVVNGTEPSTDASRKATLARIESTTRTGDAYDVKVDLTFADATAGIATVHVVKQGDAYLVCGGMNQ